MPFSLAPPVGPELVTNGGFEWTVDTPFTADVGDPGTKTLPPGAAMPEGWVVNGSGAILWLTDGTKRWSYPPHAYEGDCFLDLTEFGGNHSGGVVQRIHAEPGRKYRVSLALGTGGYSPDTEAPVQVQALFVGYFSTLTPQYRVLGNATFRRDDTPYNAATWKVMSEDVVLNDDPEEVADEALVAAIHERFGGPWGDEADADAAGPRWMFFQVSTNDLTAERAKIPRPPSTYVGLDAVSVRQVPMRPLEVVSVLLGLLRELFDFRSGPSKVRKPPRLP